MGCWTSIEQGTVGVQEIWGRYDSIKDPGCVWLGCLGTTIRGPVSLRTRQIRVKVDSFTKDNVSVHVDMQIQFRVNPNKVYEAFYTLENVHGQIRSYVVDAVRDKVPSRELSSLILHKHDLAALIHHELVPAMDPYGYLIVQILITDIEIDARVKAAMNEIVTAERHRSAVTAKAEAAKLLTIKEAEADAAAKELSGKGLAASRTAIISGLRETVSEFTESFHGLDAKAVMNLVLLSQYYDTLKEIGASPNSNLVFLPPKDFAGLIQNGLIANDSKKSL